jgi:hypothetical protein
MKSALFFLAACFFSDIAFAQHTVHLRTLWEKPQVHVLFEGYTLSFSIKDIDKALLLLAESGDTTFGVSSRLDTNIHHNIELYPGSRMQYNNRLQPLMQNGVGAFLLAAGHAGIISKKRKKLKEITIDIGDLAPGEDVVVVTAFDPKNKKMIFWGKMKADLYNKDLGID